MGLIEVGEKLHIVERRYFEDDLRRHFAGEVLSAEDNTVRLKGYVWVFNTSTNQFQKRPEVRERIVVMGERHTVNVIPQEVVVEDLRYEHVQGIGLVVTDGKDFSLQINEFTSTI